MARGAALFGIVSLALALAGCRTEQPEACRAYLACFYGNGTSPYEILGDGGYVPLADAGPAMEEAFGEDGECWKHGEGHALYARCLEACLGAIAAACALKDEAERKAACVVDAGEQATFQSSGGALSCADVEARVSALYAEADGGSEAPEEP